jgi:hypothetical protein
MRGGMNGRALQNESEYVHQQGASSSMQSVKLVSVAPPFRPMPSNRAMPRRRRIIAFAGASAISTSVPTTRSVRELKPEYLIGPWIAAIAAALLAVRSPLDRGG